MKARNWILCTVTVATLTALAPSTAQAQWWPGGGFTLPDPIVRFFWFGWELAGRDLNGIDLNGNVLDGHVITHIQFQNAKVNGDKPLFLWVGKSKLHGIDGHLQLIKDEDFKNAKFNAVLDDGTRLKVKIKYWDTHPDAHNFDVRLYYVKYRVKKGWKWMCGTDDTGAPFGAVALKGRWDFSEGTSTGGSWKRDPQNFTFACEDSVIGKCTTHGYAPWRIAKMTKCTSGSQNCTTEYVPLRKYHQTCTRMLRADYCGDGTSYTMNHVWVNAYDVYGIRYDSEDWAEEAEWGPGGAVCMTQSRLKDVKPACAQRLYHPDCGEHKRFDKKTTLMISEIQPVTPAP